MRIEESAIIAHLAANLASGSQLFGSYDVIDFVDVVLEPVAAQVRLERMVLADAVRGDAVTYDAAYSFSVYTDLPNASPTEKVAAQAMLEDGITALLSWQYAPMQYPQMLDGLDTKFDGRVLRTSIGFSIPAHFAAS
jgi:hypothetical protein